MLRRVEIGGLLSAGAVAAAVALGGAFDPIQRLVLGIAIALICGSAIAFSGSEPLPEEWLALAVIGWGTVSAAVATGYPDAARRALGGWLVAWMVWLIARRSPIAWRRSVAPVVTVVAVLVAVAVLMECAGAGRIRMGGLFVNPNVAAALLVPAVPAAAAMLAVRRRRWVMVVTLAVLAAGILMSGSRAGLLALVIVAGLMLPRGRVRTLGLTAVALVASGILIWRFMIRPDPLAWHRIEIWRALASLVVESPIFGVGPGWLEEATGVVRIAHEGGIARWGHVIGSAESTPFGLLVRTGVVGFGLAVASVIVWWRRRSRSDAGERNVAAHALVVGTAVLALFHDFLDVDVVLWWWALLLGTAEPTQVERGGGARRFGFASTLAAGLTAVFLVLWTVATPALARRIWWSEASGLGLADRAQRVDSWYANPVEWRVDELLAASSWSWEQGAEAISWSRRAAELHPGSARVWSRLGDVHARVASELGPWPDALAGASEGYQRATALEPHLPWYWLQWAAFERSVGRLDEARRLAERSVSEEPNFVRGWLFLARLALDRGDRSAARASYDRAREGTELGRGRELSDYERDLLRAPGWQVRELAAELDVSGAGAGS